MKQRLDFHKLYYNLDKILFLFFIIFMVMEYLWLPFNSWAADSLLRLTGYQFLSYNNVLAVLSSNLLLTLAFIISSESASRLFSGWFALFRCS